MTAQVNIDVVEEKALSAFRKQRRLPVRALRALLHAQRLLGLAFGLEIAQRRSEAEPLQQAFGQAKLNEILLRAFKEVADILGEHLDKIHESRRPITRPSSATASFAQESSQPFPTGNRSALSRRSHHHRPLGARSGAQPR
jgi:hypothetical protein